MVNLNSLQIFIKVAECESFSNAAKILNIPKSKISRHIVELESKLKVQLIYRTTRKFSLTSNGKILFESCRDQIVAIQNNLSNVVNQTTKLKGILRITAIEDMGLAALNSIIVEFRKIHPEVLMDLIYGVEVLDLVHESIDIALRVGKVKETSFKIKRVGSFRGILVASPRYFQTLPKLTSIEQLKEYDLISNGRAGCLREVQLTNGNNIKKFTMTPKIACMNMQALVELAIAGEGIALVPDFLCVSALIEKRLVHIFPEWHTKVRPVSFVLPSQSSNIVRAFLNFSSPKLTHFFSTFDLNCL